jgi:hypothetical protein
MAVRIVDHGDEQALVVKTIAMSCYSCSLLLLQADRRANVHTICPLDTRPNFNWNIALYWGESIIKHRNRPVLVDELFQLHIWWNLPITEPQWAEISSRCRKVHLNTGTLNMDYRDSRSPTLYSFSDKDGFPLCPAFFKTVFTVFVFVGLMMVHTCRTVLPF